MSYTLPGWVGGDGWSVALPMATVHNYVWLRYLSNYFLSQSNFLITRDDVSHYI